MPRTSHRTTRVVAGRVFSVLFTNNEFLYITESIFDVLMQPILKKYVDFKQKLVK